MIKDFLANGEQAIMNLTASCITQMHEVGSVHHDHWATWSQKFNHRNCFKTQNSSFQIWHFCHQPWFWEAEVEDCYHSFHAQNRPGISGQSTFKHLFLEWELQEEWLICLLKPQYMQCDINKWFTEACNKLLGGWNCQECKQCSWCPCSPNCTRKDCPKKQFHHGSVWTCWKGKNNLLTLSAHKGWIPVHSVSRPHEFLLISLF